MKGRKQKKKMFRIPVEAVLKLHSRPITTRKGKKGYDRKRLNQQIDKITDNELSEENN